jgi:hypothetical protein
MILLHNIRERLKNFPLTIAFRAARLRWRVHAAPPVLIFQMGKVGSTSLHGSLRPLWPGLTIHTHNIAKDIERNKKGIRLVYDRVIQKGGPLFVISPVREPIARNISDFFQNFELYTGVNYNESTFSIEELIELFLRKSYHNGPGAWHDTHFKPIFGIDVYDYEFPPNGVQVIHHNNTKLLVMRSELPDCVKESVVRDFLNLPIFSLANRNVASDKEYSEAYRKFKEAFSPPNWYIQKMYESRFFKHFYGEKQKEKLIRKWTQKGRLQQKQDSTSLVEDLVDS